MKGISLLVSAVLAFFMLSASAAPPQRASIRELSPDLRPRVSRAIPAKTRGARKQAAPTEIVLPAGVGDADSFGRNERYLGLAQTGVVYLSTDCASEPVVEGDRCVTLNPAPSGTSFSESDLARIDLPANAANSLICFALTPFVDFEFFNGTGAPQFDARFLARARITIENEVLNDPTIVDPSGVPYGGSFVTTLTTYFESRSLAVDERAAKSTTQTRSCIGGLISKSFLIDGLGLNETQATAFFAHPITFRLGSTGSVSLLSYGSYLYGIRLYGD